MTDESFSNIWLIDYDGTNNRPITTGNFKDNSLKWSNKGDKFIFKSNREGKSQIFLYDLNNNFKWDSGSWQDKIQPEQVRYYPTEIDIRTNWELVLDWL